MELEAELGVGSAAPHSVAEAQMMVLKGERKAESLLWLRVGEVPAWKVSER